MSINFSEIIVIAVVALVAIKPEQLPELARKLGRFIGSTKRTISKFTDEIQKVTDSSYPPPKRSSENQRDQSS